MKKIIKKPKKIKIKLDNEAREDLRKYLIKHTKGCVIQGGIISGKKKSFGWPCGTCVIDLLSRIGLDSEKEEYKKSNETPERHNEIWRAILQIRDAK